MDDKSASGMPQPPIPTDSPRDLCEVGVSEWIAECDRWLTVEFKRTFALVKDGVVLDPEALKLAALDLSSLSNALTLAADSQGLESRLLWEFGSHLQRFALSANLLDLGRAAEMVSTVPGLVMSLRNRLVLAQRQKQDEPVADRRWKILDVEERRFEIRSMARKKSGETFIGLSRAVAAKTGTTPSAVKSWVVRRPEFHGEVLRTLNGKPAK